MKKHPGIVFSLWSLETVFLLSILMALVDWKPYVEGSILFVWSAFCFYFVTYYHAKWVIEIDKKLYEKQKERASGKSRGS